MCDGCNLNSQPRLQVNWCPNGVVVNTFSSRSEDSTGGLSSSLPPCYCTVTSESAKSYEERRKKNRAFPHILGTLLSYMSYTWSHRKIRLKEGNAKCRHLKKLTCNGTWRQVFICLRPRTPYPPPLYTVYVYNVFTVFLFTQTWGGGVEPERRGFTKLGRKYQHDRLYLQSINS